MTKPDAFRLDPANYPFSILIGTRYGDLDTNGHLNNVAIARYFEDARVRFQTELAGGRRPVGARGLVAAVHIDYLAEGFYPAPVFVTAGIGTIGSSSWRVLEAAFQEDRRIAVCETVFVRLRDGKPTPIDDDWRALLESKRVEGPG
ncbi:MAG: acyl-CoA thioesterase [Parasphingopyxis sp.]|nr:acyl-CoA thioesterase [Sphingomonadales bacterium]